MMSRADRKLWAEARTLADLGELTALWLERSVREHPGYPGKDGPDPETMPIAGVLAKLNRAGFVTIQSQPGYAGFSYDGAYWEQRACVEGFASDEEAHRLTTVASTAGFLVMLHRSDSHSPASLEVTRMEDSFHTRAGVWLSRGFLRGACSPFTGCHPDAIDAVCDAIQVTIIDPQWGRDTMWDTLAKAVR